MDPVTACVLVAFLVAFCWIIYDANRPMSISGREVGREDWSTGDPSSPGTYFVRLGDEVTVGQLRAMEHEGESLYCEWYVVGEEQPVSGDDIDAWIGPIELPAS